jgi:hypothetical protein
MMAVAHGTEVRRGACSALARCGALAWCGATLAWCGTMPLARQGGTDSVALAWPHTMVWYRCDPAPRHGQPSMAVTPDPTLSVRRLLSPSQISPDLLTLSLS